MLAGWLVGWLLAGWLLAGWLSGCWLAGCLAGFSGFKQNGGLRYVFLRFSEVLIREDPGRVGVSSERK